MIISTPENWDISSRRWKGRKNIANKNIKLFIADELHLLNEGNSTYEVVVSRMRHFNSQLAVPAKPTDANKANKNNDTF